jgi:dienelactone hydrolase
VTFDYFQVPGANHPVILILPISGGRRYPAEEIFARHFARQGFAAIIAHRWKPPSEFDLGAIDRWLRLSLEENQLALDGIETRPELDASRIGLFGISMGGIRGVMLTALDPRIKASVFGLAGSDLPAILAHSRDRGIVRRRAKLLSEGEWTPAELEAALREAITCEPREFAAHVDPHRSLLVLGVFDRVVPFARGWQLREELGEPETLLLPTGHYTAVLAIPAIQLKSVEFFETRLGIGPSASERQRARSPRDAPWW